MDDVDEVADDELWRRAARGQAECFGLLFERHERAVRAYCHRRTGSLDAADWTVPGLVDTRLCRS